MLVLCLRPLYLHPYYATNVLFCVLCVAVGRSSCPSSCVCYVTTGRARSQVRRHIHTWPILEILSILFFFKDYGVLVIGRKERLRKRSLNVLLCVCRTGLGYIKEVIKEEVAKTVSTVRVKHKNILISWGVSMTSLSIALHYDEALCSFVQYDERVSVRSDVLILERRECVMIPLCVYDISNDPPGEECDGDCQHPDAQGKYLSVPQVSYKAKLQSALHDFQSALLNFHDLPQYSL
jgi:hypothetical protein